MMHWTWPITIGLVIIVFGVRAIPYILGKYTPKSLINSASLLPTYIIMCLVIYELNPKIFFTSPFGIPELLALLVTAVASFRLKNPILSLLIGCTFFFLLNGMLSW